MKQNCVELTNASRSFLPCDWWRRGANADTAPKSDIVWQPVSTGYCLDKPLRMKYDMKLDGYYVDSTVV